MKSVIKEAWSHTGTAERVLYAALAALGIGLIVLGWWAETTNWAGSHAYLIGLIDGATGFCFGVPVAGVLIREISRRTTESADKRLAAAAVNSQLAYLLMLVEGWTATPATSVSDWLQQSAASAHRAAATASAEVQGVTVGIIVESFHGFGVKLSIREREAAKLRWSVADDAQWASIGFSCGRLATDLPRLMAILYPPGLSQGVVPDWLNNLAGALQRLLMTQLPAQYKWLPPALKDPPEWVKVKSTLTTIFPSSDPSASSVLIH